MFMQTLLPLIVAVGMGFAMLLGIVVGRQFGLRHLAAGRKIDREGVGEVEGALFALFGLLLAFTFAAAFDRYDERRMLLSEEASAIHTAYVRMDLLPEAAQPTIRALFIPYVESRIDYFQVKEGELTISGNSLAESQQLQREIWATTMAALKDKGWPIAETQLITQALNQMVDISYKRAMIVKLHPPLIVFLLLIGVAVLCSLVAGYRMAHGPAMHWFHKLTFILVFCATVYVLIEVEYPRIGFIRMSGYDEMLLDLLDHMKKG